jgi:hypothetical protein
MNLLSDLLNGSPLVDQAASSSDGITLQWLADNAEEQWSAAVTAVSRLPAAPLLTSILSALSTHPLDSYVTSAYLPVIPADQWRSDFAADPGAPDAVDPEDWVEFLPGASGDYGVIVPESASLDFELALFSGPSTRVLVGLGRRLRGRRVTVAQSDDGCAMSASGPCVSDGDCRGSCEKRPFIGRYGEGVRCTCPDSDSGATAVTYVQVETRADHGRELAGAG